VLDILVGCSLVDIEEKKFILKILGFTVLFHVELMIFEALISKIHNQYVMILINIGFMILKDHDLNVQNIITRGEDGIFIFKYIIELFI